MGCGNSKEGVTKAGTQPEKPAENHLDIFKMGLMVSNESKSFKYNRQEDYIKYEGPVKPPAGKDTATQSTTTAADLGQWRVGGEEGASERTYKAPKVTYPKIDWNIQLPPKA